ncbi:MAG TPA: NAD(P)/FAD-dependent oxidoreductase, partial [Gemmatimonadaceae bacterium]|nr:NAD(P)/FAD-dependent oxidoreductase [Gemmatimonadaceae bacterium]
MSADAIVVGAGPNGLAAAVALARAGHSVRVYEAAPAVGGGSSSAALTEPGFVHDVCSAVHALVLASPFLKTLPLGDHGLEYVHPGVPFAHPLDNGSAAVGRRDVVATANGFSQRDARAYRDLVAPFVDRADDLMEALLGPLGLRHPFLMARFGVHAIRSAESLANGYFESDAARAYVAGLAAHSMVALDRASTAGYALGLVVGAHAVGWPVVRGGSQGFANAMASYLQSLGGEIVTGT